MSKNKKMSINQAMKEIDLALEIFEETAQETLHKEFGFGPKRQARFMERFKENAYVKLLQQQRKMKRMIK